MPFVLFLSISFPILSCLSFLFYDLFSIRVASAAVVRITGEGVSAASVSADDFASSLVAAINTLVGKELMTNDDVNVIQIRDGSAIIEYTVTSRESPGAALCGLKAVVTDRLVAELKKKMSAASGSELTSLSPCGDCADANADCESALASVAPAPSAASASSGGGSGTILAIIIVVLILLVGVVWWCWLLIMSCFGRQYTPKEASDGSTCARWYSALASKRPRPSPRYV